MVRTEALKYIQLLHERGEGSLKISKRLGLSRNTVRKYLALLDSGQPIVFVSSELVLWIPMKIDQETVCRLPRSLPQSPTSIKGAAGFGSAAAHAAKVLSALAQNRAHAAGTRGTL